MTNYSFEEYVQGLIDEKDLVTIYTKTGGRISAKIQGMDAWTVLVREGGTSQILFLDSIERIVKDDTTMREELIKLKKYCG